MQGMPSFSLTMLPSLESATATVSPVAFLFKNFFRPAAYICMRGGRTELRMHTAGGMPAHPCSACRPAATRQQPVPLWYWQLVKGLELDHLHRVGCPERLCWLTSCWLAHSSSVRVRACRLAGCSAAGQALHRALICMHAMRQSALHLCLTFV